MSGIRDDIQDVIAGPVIRPNMYYEDYEFQINTVDKLGNKHISRILGYADTEQKARQLQTDIINSLKALYFIK